MGESTVIVQQRSTAVGRSGAKQAREAKGREADLGAVHLKKQKWTFSSRLKNLFSSERRTAKLKERQAIAASVKQSASSAARATPDLTDIIVSDSKDKSPSQDGGSNPSSMAESTENHASNIGVKLQGDGAQYAEKAARIFENPLYNPHLDSAGDDQVYNDIIKNGRGDSLLVALERPGSSSTVLLRAEQIRFHYGLDKAEPRTRNAIVGSIGDLVARNFTTASSDSLANQVFIEIHKHGFGSSRSRIDDIVWFDWKFERNKENGAVTARYEINFLNSSGGLARASGSIEVSSDGELRSASRITVSGMGERNLANSSAKRVIEPDDSKDANAAASEGLYDLPPRLSDEGDDALSEGPLDSRSIEVDPQLPELPPDDIDEVDHGSKLPLVSQRGDAWTSARPVLREKTHSPASKVNSSSSKSTYDPELENKEDWEREIVLTVRSLQSQDLKPTAQSALDDMLASTGWKLRDRKGKNAGEFEKELIRRTILQTLCIGHLESTPPVLKRLRAASADSTEGKFYQMIRESVRNVIADNDKPAQKTVDQHAATVLKRKRWDKAAKAVNRLKSQEVKLREMIPDRMLNTMANAAQTKKIDLTSFANSVINAKRDPKNPKKILGVTEAEGRMIAALAEYERLRMSFEKLQITMKAMLAVAQAESFSSDPVESFLQAFPPGIQRKFPDLDDADRKELIRSMAEGAIPDQGKFKEVRECLGEIKDYTIAQACLYWSTFNFARDQLLKNSK